MPASPDPTERPGTSLPAALLDAAEAEIVERGFAAVSLRGIARRVGVSHQAPGHHFGDRIGLFTALAAKGFDTLGRELVEAEEQEGPAATPIDRLLATGVAYVRFARLHPALFETMFRTDLQRPEDPDLARAREQSFGVLLGAVTAARASGWGAHHGDHTLALLCWTAVHGTATLWRDGALATFFGEDDAEAVARHVTATIGIALAAPGPPPAGSV